MTTLKTQGIVKKFNKLAVVNRVDMALNGGEIVGLLGRTVQAKQPVLT
ncbi:MAG: hypothetical protein CM1200mP41_25950 [Gammaproteobacteria bacterium]|nr:MAG: hypothetical protein CM1200mP41_25950 [Gammaproteobacteria bacterium]